MDALEPFRCDGPIQDPTPSDYLGSASKDAYDVVLQVSLETEQGNSAVISTSNLKYMYWSFKQQLAHHTVNGCNMNSGDLCGTGTLSGPVYYFNIRHQILMVVCWN